MGLLLVLGNGERVLQSDIDKAVESVLSTLKKELHDEVRTVEFVEFVLDKCKKEIRHKAIVL